VIQQPSSSERGAVAIEFALSAIVLFVLVFGCIGVAMAFYTYEVVNQYARDASRFAIVHGNGCNSPINGNCSIGTGATANTALKTYLNNQILPGINGPNLTVTTNYTFAPGATACNVPTTCNGAGDQVTVTIAYPYLYNIPFIPTRLITMSASSTMIISQ
jgi:Flp pilus assembly protein TadG